jgi:hypothetical protein
MSDQQDDSNCGQAVTADEDRQVPLDRWHLIRDAVQFQIKLAIDGLRDLILMPLSALGAVLTLFGVRDTPLEFYNIVRWGKRTERAINLFGAAKQLPADLQFNETVSVDRLLERVESLLVEQYRKGGVTAQAKDAIDRALGGIGKRS